MRELKQGEEGEKDRAEGREGWADGVCVCVVKGGGVGAGYEKNRTYCFSSN